MIFRIRDHDATLERYASTWAPRELELERYLLPGKNDEPLLDESVFREPLLLVSNQVRTRESKRADILALDQAGCGVVIELKRHQGGLGVDMQALQYLASFSVFKGLEFLSKFGEGAALRDRVQGFLGDEVRLEEVNRRSRIILVARSFDPTLFSMGEWLAKAGVAFRCIEYTPFGSLWRQVPFVLSRVRSCSRVSLPPRLPSIGARARHLLAQHRSAGRNVVASTEDSA